MTNELIESSVQSKPTEARRQSAFFFANLYDKTVPDWWSPSRDAFFRDFWPQESTLASAIYSVAARNAAFGWELVGLPDDVEYGQNLLQSADFGGGWQQLITKTTIDLLVTDNGGFWEIIRPAKVRIDGLVLPAVKQYYEDSPTPEWFAVRSNGKKIRLRDRDYKLFDSPLDLPIGIAHLDSGRVTRTGNPEIPIIYQDLDGRDHKMRWWQAVSFSDMPSPIEEMNGIGLCALSRVFRYAHTLQSMSIYKDEKISGRFARAIHITNADPDLIADQIMQANANADNAGVSRYSQPIIASTFDPGADPRVATIELASMPDGFNEETTMDWYIAILALALGVDYGFLAPLPGKGLGTASQSETMARQSRGKSSRLFMDTTSNAINFRGILPQSVRFRYIERDTQQEREEEQVKQLRAQTRQIMIKSGEITPQIARQIAADDGDLNEEYLRAIGEQNMTPGIEIEGDHPIASDIALADSAQPALLQPEQFEVQSVEPDLIEPEPVETRSIKEPTFDKKAIQEREEHLFGTATLATKITNAARSAFGKKQSASLENALILYESELLELAESLQYKLIDRDTFSSLLIALSTLTVLAFYAHAYGSTDFDKSNLSAVLSLIEPSADSFSRDIDSGRYTDRRDMLERRITLWTNAPQYAHTLGTLSASNPDARFTFTKGPTSDNCADCSALDGQTRTASEWLSDRERLPQSPFLACHGFNCLCTLTKS